MIIMPQMSAAQAASWHGVMDLHERLDHGWTLVGGQLVHLHCAERDYAPPRPTDDIDTVIDVRAETTMLRTFTTTLTDLGFTSGGVSAEGIQHWPLTPRSETLPRADTASTSPPSPLSSPHATSATRS
jgi:hypothetical protein